jgi:hypothetical protein
MGWRNSGVSQMTEEVPSPNHGIIVDPLILAQAAAQRQVTSELSDEFFVQLCRRKALPLDPYSQMRGGTQVCLPSPYSIALCMKRLGEIVHVPAGWLGSESPQCVI